MSAMRWQDMTPDQPYALAGDPRVKVTVLDTPAELRAKARVLVRFETGVSAGRVCDIPSRRIAGPWGKAASPPDRAPHRRPDIPVLPLHRPARVGDQVTLDEAGDWIWTVDSVDESRAEATITTRIFERPYTRTASLDRLRVRLNPRRRTHAGGGVRPPANPPVAESADADAERLRPIAPRRELDEIMDDLLFTRACVRDYDRRLGAGQRGAAIERLREEVRRKGYLLREAPQRNGEHARIRVNGRFDIVLARKPTADAPLTIGSLYFPTSKSSRRRRRRRGRQRAA